MDGSEDDAEEDQGLLFFDLFGDRFRAVSVDFFLGVKSSPKVQLQVNPQTKKMQLDAIFYHFSHVKMVLVFYNSTGRKGPTLAVRPRGNTRSVPLRCWPPWRISPSPPVAGPDMFFWSKAVDVQKVSITLKKKVRSSKH